MIFREVNCLAILTNHTARVTSISAVYVCLCDQNHIGGAASLISILCAWHVVRVLSSNTLELLLAIGAQKHLIDLYKDFSQRQLVVLCLESRIILQLLNKMIATIFCHFRATVTIEDSEKRHARKKVGGRDMSIFVRLTPALHARSSKFKYLVFALI